MALAGFRLWPEIKHKILVAFDRRGSRRLSSSFLHYLSILSRPEKLLLDDPLEKPRVFLSHLYYYRGGL
ncbi:hypothetical protein NL676_007458 [Syzygium grande]|nr:hypothetical protein NL676_007458 [Syzygium grande]